MADLLRVVLIRHGRTAWNAERRFLGTTDLGLDDVGRAEALALVGAVGGRFDAIFSSPLTRALETAAPLAPPAPEVVDDLREVGQGELEGLTIDAALAAHPDFFARWGVDPTDARVPGGETLGEARDRGLAALTGIVARCGRPGRIAVVSHQLVISSVLATLRGRPLLEFRAFGLPNAGMVNLSWDGDSLRFDPSLGAGGSTGSAV